MPKFKQARDSGGFSRDEGREMRETVPAEPGEAESWYIKRAEQELELAQRAEHPAVVRAHYLMAESYLERANDSDEESQADAA